MARAWDPEKQASESCLKRFEDFTSRKIGEVCTQLTCNFLFLQQEISQSSTLFHKLFMLGFLCSFRVR